MNYKNPIKIGVTGRTAFPGENSSYVLQQDRNHGIIQRLFRPVAEKFAALLPDRGGKATTSDTALIIKTSPNIWEYEMFRLEWDRRTILREMDLILRSDPRMKRANRVFASTSVRRGFSVDVTSESSKSLADRAQVIIDDVMRDCQINAKLASWARILLKEGDLFLNPVIDLATKRLKNIKRLPAVSMQRNDDMMGNFQNLDAAFQQIDPISLEIIEEFPLWACNHIRWDHEEGDRYGNSMYLQIRGYWKKLNMTEEDLVVRRRTRAMLRRHHKIGNPSNPGDPSAINEYMAMNNLDRPDVARYITDYYSNALVDITNLDGDAHLDQIRDVEHLQEVYMLGTGVPLHMLGFGKNVNRDIVEDQIKQFKEDTQELRDLLEYGDSSAYSGLRFIFDFALALQGIDPQLVQYNISWFAADNETASDRIDRIIKMRASQPVPIISLETALMTISKDINLENADAVAAEIEKIRNEFASDSNIQSALKHALNPEKPSASPLSHSTVSKLDSVLQDSEGTSKKKIRTPLRTREFARLERRYERLLRKRAQAVLNAVQPTFRAVQEKAAKLDSNDLRKAIARELNDAVSNALRSTVHEFANDIHSVYVQAADLGARFAIREAAKRQTRRAAMMTDDTSSMDEQAPKFVSERTILDLAEKAGIRVRHIDEATRKILAQQLSEAYRNAEPVDQWLDRIRSVVNCDFPRGRDEMIARTELSWSYSRGLFSAYHDLGVTQVKWLTIIDNRTCARCAARDGQTYKTDDVDGQLPLHPRCRCTVVSVD